MITIPCEVPEPTVDQCRAWLKKNGWTFEARYNATEYFAHERWNGRVGVVDDDIDLKVNPDMAKGWDSYIAFWILRRATDVHRHPGQVYREIVGTQEVFVARSSSGVEGVYSSANKAWAAGEHFTSVTKYEVDE